MKKMAVIMAFMVFLTGCLPHQKSLKERLEEMETVTQTTTDQASNQATDALSEDTAEIETTTETRETLAGLSVEDRIAKMTLEEKVAQLFIIDFYTFNKGSQVTEVTPGLTERLDRYPVGGVIFFGDNIVDRNQVVSLIQSIQTQARTPMFISVDEEGGLVSRLQKNPEIGMTPIPTAASIGAHNNPEEAYQVGTILGEELNALGFNMDFAPVADVNTNPNNPVIGDRAFSADQQIVAAMVTQEIEGLQQQHVAAVTKHFPGHGDTSTDTHTGAVFVEHDMKRLNAVELVPFKKAIETGTMGVMVAHIALPKVTGMDEPASLSNDIITKLLREELGYQGVVITDALNMGAVADAYSADAACVKALQAGVDLLLMPEDFELAYNGVLKAVGDGVLTEERINISVKRILELKDTLGVLNSNIPRLPLSVIGSQEHLDRIKKITE